MTVQEAAQKMAATVTERLQTHSCPHPGGSSKAYCIVCSLVEVTAAVLATADASWNAAIDKAADYMRAAGPGRRSDHVRNIESLRRDETKGEQNP